MIATPTLKSSPSAGSLVMIGGRLESDNDAIFTELKRLSGGRIAVFATASEYPLEVGGDTVQDLQSHGIEAELIELYWEDRRRAAFDPKIIARTAGFGSVFFTGGNQARIVQALVQHGVETPLLETVRDLQRSGGLIAGTSAGAAIMSQTMILGGTSLEALSCGVIDAGDEGDGLRLGAGLGFFPWGIVDQHFLKRGRLGRLVAATAASGNSRGFGVDENSALVVTGRSAQVLGETGVVLVDTTGMRSNVGGDIAGVRVSYLDDGDCYDLKRRKILPAPDKKRIRASKSSFRSPAPIRRHAFGSYTLHELLLRLVEGDPGHYRLDDALAYDREQRKLIRVEIERIPRRSRALRARRNGESRYTAIGFQLNVQTRTLDRLDAVRPAPAVRVPEPVSGARLILLGNSPLGWGPESTRSLYRRLSEPVGILPTASGRPRTTGGEYLAWLQNLGVEAQVLDVTAWNIEAASRDRQLLKRLASMGTLLFTGGDQRRLTETLLHCAEATPVLRTIVRTYESGATLIGVGGAAAAFGTRMIAEGTSCEALRYGASEDAGYEGLVIEEGFGLIDFALVDQNFLNRRRLGRLVVACAEEGYRHGFGVCEETGMIIAGRNRTVRAFGRHGVVIATLDPGQVQLDPTTFAADGIRLTLMGPSGSFDVERGTMSDGHASNVGSATLERAVSELARDCDAELGPGRIPAGGAWLHLDYLAGVPASLDIQSRRA